MSIDDGITKAVLLIVATCFLGLLLWLGYIIYKVASTEYDCQPTGRITNQVMIVNKTIFNYTAPEMVCTEK